MTQASLERRVLSKPIPRREDPRLLTGGGRFVDDVGFPDMMHLAVVRSPHGHARILGIDKSAALKVDGVVDVIVPGDYPELEIPMPDILEPGTLKNPYCDLHLTNPHYVLARGKTTFQGEPVAMVVAESRHAANAGVQAVSVEYEPLPAIVCAESAMKPDAERVHEANPNAICHLQVEHGDVDAAFAGAEIVLEERLSLQRVASMAMEGRGVVAAWDPLRGELTVWSTNQVPYRLRDAIARMLDLPYEHVRIISGDIGGAFGGKGLCPEDMATAAVARRWRRPVKWIESRSENFVAVHARDQTHTVRVAARKDGTLLGMDLTLVKDVGAYNSYEMVQTTNTVNHVLSHYRVPAFRAEGWCVVTNKTEVRPTRGAGRPEAAFVMDRMLDFVAQATGIDPLELRLRNIIPAEAMPYSNGLTYRDGVPITYDGGDYPGLLKRVAETFDYAGWRRRQAQAREAGRLIGIGISSSLEAGGVGPCEGACITIDDRGRVSVAIGVNSQGQSHETTFAQVCAEYLDVPLERVRILNGDTRLMRHGFGTGASRVGVNTGNAVMLAALSLKEKIKAFAAQMLGVTADEIGLQEESAFVSAAPDRRRSFAELARIASAHRGMDPLGGPGLTATEFYYPDTVTWSSAVQMVAVEVDRETGIVGILDYVMAHDCGLPLNAMVVDGQCQGGLVQGLGAALGEAMIYDDNGQLLTGSFMDYPMLRAADVPPLKIEHLDRPTDKNPLGMRAVGEGASVSPPAALAGAVEDALHHRCRIRAMPLTPQRVFELLKEARLLL